MRILLATDGSEYSEWVARFLTRLNWSAEDAITVFHAIFWMPFGHDQASYLGVLREIKTEIAPRILDSALDILRPVPASKSVALEDGAPEQCIADAALNLNVDMIVMGGKGTRAVESPFLGSVTKSIAVNAPRPVLIVKRKEYEKPGGMKVLFATDGSEHCRATEGVLLSIPFADDTEITVLNVAWSTSSDIPERFIREGDEFTKIAADMNSRGVTEPERVIREAAGRLTKRFKSIHALSRSGDPSNQILRTAEEIGADIIAVGCRGLRGIKGILGSVARNIVTHAKCSVLVGKIS